MKREVEISVVLKCTSCFRRLVAKRKFDLDRQPDSSVVHDAAMEADAAVMADAKKRGWAPCGDTSRGEWECARCKDPDDEPKPTGGAE